MAVSVDPGKMPKAESMRRLALGSALACYGLTPFFCFLSSWNSCPIPFSAATVLRNGARGVTQRALHRLQIWRVPVVVNLSKT